MDTQQSETAGQRLYWLTTAELALNPSEMHLLRLATNALDEIERLEMVIATDGAVVLDRFGQQRPHPAVAMRNDARRFAADVLSRLRLDRPELIIADDDLDEERD